jgi:hypothetical protein
MEYSDYEGINFAKSYITKEAAIRDLKGFAQKEKEYLEFVKKEHPPFTEDDKTHLDFSLENVEKVLQEGEMEYKNF